MVKYIHKKKNLYNVFIEESVVFRLYWILPTPLFFGKGVEV